MLRVNIWLAPDACLIAACALGLLGAYRGYITPRRLPKLAWYALLNVGAALAFMAKNVSGGMIPFLALGVLIAWERNWSEMLRVELYAGLLLLAAIIGPWLLEVLACPDGSVMPADGGYS